MRPLFATLALGAVLCAACTGDDGSPTRPSRLAPRLRDPGDVATKCLALALSPRERQACIASLRAREAGTARLEGRYRCALYGPPQHKDLGCIDGVCLEVWTNVCGDIFFEITDVDAGVQMWLGPDGCTDCRPF
jgi:hypothetical protein